MKALVWTKDTTVELLDIPEPQVSPGMAKIKMSYAALCATDVHGVERNYYGLTPPVPQGHEGCGVIVELGEGMAELGWKVGDRVTFSGYSACGVCEACKRGDDVFCKNMFSYPKFCEYTLAKANMMFKIPDDVDDIRPYCLAEPCASAMRGIDLADIKIGANVAISGAGGIGSILLNMLLLRGGTRVTVIDPAISKYEMFKEMGADYIINPKEEDVVSRAMEITNGHGFDVVFEASGAPAATPPILKILGNKGTAVFFAVYPQDFELPVNLFQLYMKEGRIQTVFTTNYNYPRVVELIPKLRTDLIIGKEYPLSQAIEAWEMFKTAVYPKIVLNCQQ